MTARPTAAVRGPDGFPLDRDTYAAHLAEQADPQGPAEGDRVRLTYPDGQTAVGQWAYIGGDFDDSGLVADDGTPHPDAGRARREVLQRAERPRVPVLTEPEALAVAALLDELAGVYPGEPLGRLARELAVRVYDRLGI